MPNDIHGRTSFDSRSTSAQRKVRLAKAVGGYKRDDPIRVPRPSDEMAHEASPNGLFYTEISCLNYEGKALCYID